MKRINLFFLIVCVAFIACGKKSEKITNLEQLENKRICVLTGAAGDVAARKAFPNAKFMDIIAASDAALAVKSNKADAFVHNETILLNIIEKQPGLTILQPRVAEVEIAAALKKENDELREKINSVIGKLEAEGLLAQMKNKWIDTKYKSAPALPELENSAKNGTLKMGTCARSEPLSFQSNNIITGYDIELALRIGQALEKQIEIVDMPFESLIPALQSGKIDFALSNINVTEPRKNYISFSEAYLKNDISALVRK